MDEERVFRARAADFIGEARFPASKAALVTRAQGGNVPSDVLSALLQLPEETYPSLSAALDEVVRLRPAPE